MAFVIPDEGETRLLQELLDGGTSREDWYLRLYRNDYKPASNTTISAFTECNFDGYAQKTLTRTVNNGVTWSTVATGAPTAQWNIQAAVGKASYAPQSWTINSGSQTVLGYYVVGASSNKVIFAERIYDTGLYSGYPTLTLTIVFELGSGSVIT